MALSPGSRLGPYEILAPIGAGGMGEVYRARDVRLDRLVAIKISKDQFSERFEREARAVAALSHPNICHLYDVGPNYLVMEHIEGVPISATADVRAVLDVGVQIAEGLAAAHQAGIVHRDLKPANILAARDGRVKILDFGLAVLTPAHAEIGAAPTMAVTDPGTTVGTVAYMSPEQASGQTVDARSDLWSVGVVLYELATRVRPFEGATSALIFDAILNKAPIPVRERNPAAPVELARAIEKLLEKDRSLRYQSAADLRADLKRVERDGSSQRSAAAAAPPPGKGRTRRLAAIATTTIVIATLAAFATGAWFWQDNALLGNCPAAGSPLATNPFLIVLCGDAAYAVKFAEEAAQRQLPSLTWNTLQLPMIRAAAALKRNNPDDAVEMLKPAAPHDVYSPQAVYIRGLAYLAARKGTEAANEFQKIVDHRGIHWQFQPVLPRETGPLRAMAFVGVARGAALAGDTPRARKAYQDFLALWKDADPDIPILVDARKEYAALN